MFRCRKRESFPVGGNNSEILCAIYDPLKFNYFNFMPKVSTLGARLGGVPPMTMAKVMMTAQVNFPT